MTQLCIDCVHHGKRYDGWCGWSECQRPLSDERDPVTGCLTRRVWNNCDSERRNGRTLFARREKCGRDGKFFALAAGTQRAETGETSARAKGCQSGPPKEGNAQ